VITVVFLCKNAISTGADDLIISPSVIPADGFGTT
jgi:hypothetical protein